MIKRVSRVSRLEITDDGSVGVLMALELVDGDEVLSTQNHRTLVPPYVEAKDQMTLVNHHLAEMGWPQLDASCFDKVVSFQKLAVSTATKLAEPPVAE